MPGGGGGNSAYERGGDARRKFLIKLLKETDLGVAQAFFFLPLEETMLKHRQYIHFKRKILSEINKATGKFSFPQPIGPNSSME